jgi:hypothetical protein
VKLCFSRRDAMPANEKGDRSVVAILCWLLLAAYLVISCLIAVGTAIAESMSAFVTSGGR